MKLRSILFAFLLSCSLAYADNFVGTAALEVQQSDAMDVVVASQLTFGVIKPSLSNGWVYIEAASGNQASSQVAVINNGTRALWNVAGVPGRSMVVSVPNNNTVKLNSNNDEIILEDFHTDLNNGSLMLDQTGSGRFYVGARARISALQAIGNYEGTYNITLSYQ